MTILNQKIKYSLALIFILAIALPACKSSTNKRSTTTQNPKAFSASLVDFGTYSGTGGKKFSAKNTAIGEVTSYKETNLIESGDTIVAKSNLIFGFRYSFNNFPASDLNPRVTIKVQHPEMKNPETKVSLSESYWDDAVFTNPKDINTAGWAFEKHWEKLPGKWTIQIYYKKKLMIEKTFQVLEDE